MNAVTVETPPDADDTIDVTELTPELKLEAYFDSIGTEDEISIGIYQIDPSNRSRKGFLFYTEPGDLPVHELFAKCMNDYGEGEYEAIARDGQQISFSQRFVLGTVRKARTSIAAPPSAGRNFNQPTATDPNILALLQAQQKTLDALVANQSNRPSTLDMLKELKEFQQLTAPPPAPAGGGLEGALSLVTQVLELKDQLGGNDGEVDPLTQAVKTLGPAIVDAVKALQSHPRLGAPAADDAAPLAPAARSPAMEAHGVGRLIGPYLPTILANARGGVLPVDAAQQIITQLDPLAPEAKASLLDYLDDDQAVDKLAGMDAEVIQLREWFDQLVDVLCASLREQLGEAAEVSTADIDAENLETEPVVIPGGAGREVGEWPLPDVDSDAASPTAETDLSANAQSGTDHSRD